MKQHIGLQEYSAFDKKWKMLKTLLFQFVFTLKIWFKTVEWNGPRMGASMFKQYQNDPKCTPLLKSTVSPQRNGATPQADAKDAQLLLQRLRTIERIDVSTQTGNKEPEDVNCYPLRCWCFCFHHLSPMFHALNFCWFDISWQ
jgi:hypothetical protein